MTLSSNDLGKLVAGRSVSAEQASLLGKGDVVTIPSDFGNVELTYAGHDGETHLVETDGEQYVVFFDLTEVVFARPAQREAQPENRITSGLKEVLSGDVSVRGQSSPCECVRCQALADAAKPEPDGGGEDYEAAWLKAEGQLSEISAAIGSTRFMDPPDGGDVSLAEQVRRMRAALDQAEATPTPEGQTEGADWSELRGFAHERWSMDTKAQRARARKAMRQALAALSTSKEPG